MKWFIPAKTFLLGEYVALNQGPSLLLTTDPCFSLSLSQQPELKGIHPQSPAGLFWQQAAHTHHGLQWEDPYQGIGGLGASSAQFLGAYLAHCHLQKRAALMDEMQSYYYQFAWSGQGVRPSGYDLIAQSSKGCVFIDHGKALNPSFDWPFVDLSFMLLHTGAKLATHQHLQETNLPKQGIGELTALVYQALLAFRTADSQALIACVNAYHQQLKQMHLVTEHSLHCLNQLRTLREVLAIKGCGALGADVLLLLCRRTDKAPLLTQLQKLNYPVLAVDALHAAGRLGLGPTQGL